MPVFHWFTVTFGLVLVMKCLLLVVCVLICTRDAHGDAVGYTDTREIFATNGTLTARHIHHWNAPRLFLLFLDFAHPEKFFTPANNFACVELRNAHGNLLFRSPSPALSELWTSPDSRYLVGLSDIKLRNPYQLVVWQRDGTVIHREHISAKVAKLTPGQQQEFARRFPKARRFLAARSFHYGDATYLDYADLRFPGEDTAAVYRYLSAFTVPHPYSNDFGESVTNTVRWFDPEKPKISVSEEGSSLFLSLRSPGGNQMKIPLTK